MAAALLFFSLFFLVLFTANYVCDLMDEHEEILEDSEEEK